MTLRLLLLASDDDDFPAAPEAVRFASFNDLKREMSVFIAALSSDMDGIDVILQYKLGCHAATEADKAEKDGIGACSTRGTHIFHVHLHCHYYYLSQSQSQQQLLVAIMLQSLELSTKVKLARERGVILIS